MKHLNGYKKRYFSLAVYSTIDKLMKIENALEYHLKGTQGT